MTMVHTAWSDNNTAALWFITPVRSCRMCIITASSDTGSVFSCKPTHGDGIDYHVDGVLGSGGLLVEDSELENLQGGGEGDSGGGSVDEVALDDVEEGRDVDGRVYGAPFLLGVEDQGSK